MTKFQTFLWRSIITIIGFVYGRDAYSWYLYVGSHTVVSNCNSFTGVKKHDEAKDILLNSLAGLSGTTTVLCPSNLVLDYCSYHGVQYKYSEHGDSIVTNCINQTGRTIHCTTCPSPGILDDLTKHATTIKTVNTNGIYVSFCSAQDINGTLLNGPRIQFAYIRQSDASDYGLRVQQKTDCFVGPETLLRDTYGSFYYDPKCYYTE